MIEDYQKLLNKDPQSKAFAPLAEALRESGKYPEAETTALEGIKKHPSYVGGYVSLGKILLDQGRVKDATPILKKAIELDPQNLLALQLQAQLLILTDLPKEALKIYKRILFLNPQSEKARSAIEKLENLTAEDFDEDSFQYQNLQNSPSPTGENLNEDEIQIKSQENTAAPYSGAAELEIDRKLSLVDALIVRNEIQRARDLIQNLMDKYPNREDILQRQELLTEEVTEEEATPLHPLQSREKIVLDRKRKILESILEKVENLRGNGIIDYSSPR